MSAQNNIKHKNSVNTSTHSAETRKQISESNKRTWSDPELRKKNGEAVKRAMSDPEVLKKISAARKGKKHSAETLKKMSEAAKKRKPRKQTEETKKKISESGKRTWSNPKLRKRVSESLKGTKHSPAVCLANSKAQKRVWENQELRKRHSEAAKLRWKDPEYRCKMLKALKAPVSEESRRKRSEANKLPLRELFSRIPPNIEARIVKGNIEVLCGFCKKPFEPTRVAIMHAKNTFENYSGQLLYCSDICKRACPVFGHRTDRIDPRSKLAIPKTEQEKARRCQTNDLKQLQCDEVSYNYCEKCGDIIDVELHHTQPVATSGKDAVNPAGHMLLCAGCHTELHRECA